MSVEQFTGTTVLSTLNRQLECSNYQSVQITNNSNYGFTLSNVGNRVVIGYVNPWENIIMPLDSIATLGIVVNNSLNSATPFTPIQTQELLQVQFSRLTVLGTSKTSSAVITSTNITSSGVLNVQFNGTQDVQFPSAQDVNLAANNAGPIDITIDSSGNTIEVGNAVSSPVNNLPVYSSPATSTYVGVGTSWSTILTLNATCQRIFLNTSNSSTTALNSAQTYLLQLLNSSGDTIMEFSFFVGAIPAMVSSLITAGPDFVIDLSPGIYIADIEISTNIVDSGTSPTALVNVVI